MNISVTSYFLASTLLLARDIHSAEIHQYQPLISPVVCTSLTTVAAQKPTQSSNNGTQSYKSRTENIVFTFSKTHIDLSAAKKLGTPDEQALEGERMLSAQLQRRAVKNVKQTMPSAPRAVKPLSPSCENEKNESLPPGTSTELLPVNQLRSCTYGDTTKNISPRTQWTSVKTALLLPSKPPSPHESSGCCNCVIQ